MKFSVAYNQSTIGADIRILTKPLSLSLIRFLCVRVHGEICRADGTFFEGSLALSSRNFSFYDTILKSLGQTHTVLMLIKIMFFEIVCYNKIRVCQPTKKHLYFYIILWNVQQKICNCFIQSKNKNTVHLNIERCGEEK